jgi:hypothetical protein
VAMKKTQNVPKAPLVLLEIVGLTNWSGPSFSSGRGYQCIYCLLVNLMVYSRIWPCQAE